MYQPIKSLSHDEIQNILADHDQRIIFEKTNNIPTTSSAITISTSGTSNLSRSERGAFAAALTGNCLFTKVC